MDRISRCSQNVEGRFGGFGIKSQLFADGPILDRAMLSLEQSLKAMVLCLEKEGHGLEPETEFLAWIREDDLPQVEKLLSEGL